jgi:hypothetical protein
MTDRREKGERFCCFMERGRGAACQPLTPADEKHLDLADRVKYIFYVYTLGEGYDQGEVV